MLTREKYCAVCGCLFSVPDIRDPVNPDPNEDCMWAYGGTYDSRILPQDLTEWDAAKICEPTSQVTFVVRRVDGSRDSSLVNESSAPNFFLSPPATWDYTRRLGEPAVPTTAGTTADIVVYEPSDDADGMFLPIHKACLDILLRLCQIRQEQDQAFDSKKPNSLDAFCDALRQRRWKNIKKPDKSMSEDSYYGYFGGIEWPHDYYGARQFWADEWNEEPGWEFLCADPSPLKISELSSYLLSELPMSISTFTAQASSNNQLADRLGWLFPEEVDRLAGKETGCVDWEMGIQTLLQKANMISADEGGEDEESKKLASAPLGLKNRWRIWKILQGICLSD